MMFEQCKIVIFNYIYEKTLENFPEKFNGNFPEKYKIFRTNFLPHITNSDTVGILHKIAKDVHYLHLDSWFMQYCM